MEINKLNIRIIRRNETNYSDKFFINLLAHNKINCISIFENKYSKSNKFLLKLNNRYINYNLFGIELIKK